MNRLFALEQSGKNSVFIGVSGLNKNNIRSLFGDYQKGMINASFSITLDNKGNFTGVKVGEKSYSIQDWNKQFQNESTE